MIQYIYPTMQYLRLDFKHITVVYSLFSKKDKYTTSTSNQIYFVEIQHMCNPNI